MSILEYILLAAFLILLFIYILNTVINNRFRKKTVDYLKNQKNQIKEQENKIEKLAGQIRDLNSEKVGLQNTIKKKGKGIS